MALLLVLGVICYIVFLVLYVFLVKLYAKNAFRPWGKHCYITGGSSGLGKALAIELAKLGASITIASRRESELQATLEALEAMRVHPDQQFHSVSADLAHYEQSCHAFRSACQHAPVQYVFTCAGMSIPGFFVDQPIEDFERGMQINYFGSLYTLKIAAAYFIEQKIKGKLVLVGSTLGLTTLVGYAQYSPTKFALRGLADLLRHELSPFDIDVHVYFVGTIHTPGYENEEKTKPAITKYIEGVEMSDASPVTRAKTLIQGIRNNEYAICSDFLTLLFRLSSLGSAPRNSLLMDTLLLPVAFLVVPLIRIYADYLVKNRPLKQHY